MIRPVQVTFDGLQPNEALEEAARGRAGALELLYPDLIGCHVVLEVAHRHRRHGQHVHVRIELAVPGKDVVVSHEPTLHGRLRTAGADAHHKSDDIGAVHQHALVAIHEAFDAAGRRLQDFAARQRGQPKARRRPTPRRALPPDGADEGDRG